MLLCAVTTWAGVTDLPEMSTDGNIKWYTISNTRSTSGKYLYYAGDAVGLKDSNTLTGNSLFYFTGTTDACYIHNAGTSNLFKTQDAWDATGTVCSIGVTPHSSAAGLYIGFNGTYLNEKNYGTNETTSDFTTWSANDSGSIFVISPATASIESVIARIEANKEAGNTILGDYKYEEESYNRLVAALNTLKSAATENAAASFEECNNIIATLSVVMPEEGKFYVIEAPLFFNTQSVSKGLYVNNGELGWNTIDLTNKAFYWTVELSNGSYALRNTDTGTYINGTTMSESPVYGNIASLGEQQFNIIINGTTIHANNHGGGYNASGNVVSWPGSANSASAWTFLERTDPDAVSEVEIIYNFVYNDNIVVSQSTKTIVGEEYPAITIALPYGVTAGAKPEGTISPEDASQGSGVIATNIELSVELPFVPAATAEDINNWYYMQMHWNNKHYVNANGTAIEWKNTEIDPSNADAYTWGFVGNAFDGFKIVNYAAYKAGNTENTLTWNEGTSLGAHDTATTFPFVHSIWSTAPATSFCMSIPGTTNYLNAQGTGVASWSDTDAGSTTWLTERDMSGATELQALIDAVKGKYTVGTTVGYVESLDALNTAIINAEAAVESKTGCIEAQTALLAAKEALVTVQPEAGKYYFISSACNDDRNSQKIYVNNTGGMQFQNATTMGEVFQFVPADDNTFYLYNVEHDTYLSTAKTHAGGQEMATATTTDNAVKVTITNMGSENIVKIVPEGGAMIHAQASGSTVVGWDNTSYESASAWVISEVEDITTLTHTIATLTTTGYNTLYLNYAVTIPEHVNAYFVSEIKDGKLQMEQFDGVIPAKTAVILEGVHSDNCTFTYTTAEGESEVTNILKGTLIDEELTTEGAFFNLNAALCSFSFVGNSINNEAFEVYLEVSAEDAEGVSAYNFHNLTAELNEELAALIEKYDAMDISEGFQPGEYYNTEEFFRALNAAKNVTYARQSHIDALNEGYESLGIYSIHTLRPCTIINEYTGGLLSIGTYGVPVWQTTLDDLSYWTIEEGPWSNGVQTYYVKSLLDGSYLTSASTIGSEPVPVIFERIGNGEFNIKIGEETLYADGDYDGESIISSTGGAGSRASWRLYIGSGEQPTFSHTLTVGEGGYTTLYLGFNAEIPGGVKAYGITSVDNGYIQKEEITGIIPAKTAVYIEAEAGDYIFNSTTDEGTATSILKGTLYDNYATPEGTIYYITEQGLQKGSGYYTGYIPANTAYLDYVAPEGSEAPNLIPFTPEGGTTGIIGIDANGATEGVIYDITGRRINSIDAPGIYIINGKKTFVK